MTKSHARHRDPQSARARGYAALLLAGTAIAGIPLSSPAQAQTWTGALSTNWFTPGNWSPNAIPSSAAPVTIDTISPHATVIGTSAATSGSVDVGQTATGALTISGGGTLYASGSVDLGLSTGASGAVTVTGAGSSLTETGTLEVGYLGTGVLRVQNGGAILADNASIGFVGNGSATVDGAGSSLHVLNGLTVGGAASSALTVSNSGTLVTDSASTIGKFANEVGSITVTGANSTWTAAFSTVVGQNGTGSLFVSNGGVVSGTSATLGLGATAIGFATVDGAGSAWHSSLDVVLGDAGAGGLTVSNGGSVTSFHGVIGNQTGSIGSATVDGAGSTWALTGLLSVGSSGTGGLAVSNGGAVSSTGVSVGDLAGSNGTLTVTGAGSTLTSTGAGNQVVIGNSGIGSLQIASGGVVNDAFGIVGNNIGGAGFASVNGLGSQWNNTGYLAVGYVGKGSLTIANGGLVIDGAGGFIGTLAGSIGQVSVTDANSAWVNAGGIMVGNSGTGTLAVSNGGTVGSDGGTVGNFAGSSGSVTVTGANSVWHGGSGDVSLGEYGTGSMVVSNGGRVSNANAVLGQFAGSTGTATVDGAGSSWTNSGSFQVGIGGNGSVTISNGGMVFAANSVMGASHGAIGTVVVTDAGSAFLNSGNIIIGNAGTGSLTVANGGGAAAGGSITIASGVGSIGALNIGADSASAAAAPGTTSPSIAFGAGSGSINFNHTSAGYAFTPTVSGAGTINQIAGTTILGNNFSTFTGVTNVTGGRLAVNGSLAGSTVTVSGGTLGGTGTVGSTTVNGGTLAPGNSIGMLTVQGNLAFTSAGHYSVEVSPTAADLTNVTGTATLGGATVNASFGPGSYVAKRYTIVNAVGGVSGTFASIVNTNLPTGFASSLSYDANDAYLNLSLGLAQYGALNVNQQNVANALTNFFNANGGIQAVFGSLTPAGLTQVSGELATGSQQSTYDAMGLFLGTMTDPSMDRRSDVAASSAARQFADENRASGAYAMMAGKAPPAASFDSRWSTWGTGFGGSRTTSGDSVLGSNSTTGRAYGVAVGADYLLSPSTLAGFALAGGGTNFSVANGGSGRSDLFQTGLFVRHTIGPAYITAALAYGWQDVTTDRTVTVAGTDQLHANFKANAFSGRLESGYGFVTPSVDVTPYAALQLTSFALPGYGESATLGSNQFALSYAAQTTTNVRSEIGARADKAFLVGGGLLTLRTRAAWAHDSNTDRPVSATFQTLPGASFTVNGAKPAADSALLTAGAEMKWHNGLSLVGTFDGEVSGTTQSYAGKGTVRYAW